MVRDSQRVSVSQRFSATALTGQLVNSALSRRLEIARYYADALTTAEKYRQLPYALQRRHDNTRETRAEPAAMPADIQVTLVSHRRRLELDSQAVEGAYNSQANKLSEKNGESRKIALSSPVAEMMPLSR